MSASHSLALLLCMKSILSTYRRRVAGRQPPEANSQTKLKSQSPGLIVCTLFVATVGTVATLGWEFAMHNNYHSNIRRRFHKVVNDTQVRELLGFALRMMSEVCRMAACVATLVRDGKGGRTSLASLS